VVRLARPPVTENNELVQYQRLTAEGAKLEADLEANKAARAELAKQLYTRYGKAKTYDFGDGVELIISTTKIGTHFFTPKNKWAKNGTRPPKPPKEPKVKEPKAKKVVTKRAIVNGQIVEVPVTPRKPAFKVPAKPAPAPPVAAAPKPPEPQPTVEKIQPTVEPKAPKPAREVDPLEAALAEALGELPE
jgi:hypothetical protein